MVQRTEGYILVVIVIFQVDWWQLYLVQLFRFQHYDNTTNGMEQQLVHVVAG
jgi:hypothetical protein